MNALRILARTAAIVVAAMMLHGCQTYPTAAPPSVDASWRAARWAAQDEGVRVTSEDRSSGTIRGTKDSLEVLISVAQQANGSVTVAFTVRGPKGQDSNLQDRLTRAYQRRMGR